jgi:hypothetical protein
VQLRAAKTGGLVASALSDASGAYTASVPTVPLDYVLVVKLAGYLTASQTVSVPAAQQLTVNVSLAPGQDSTTGLQLVFGEPADGATVSTDSVIVYATAEGFELAEATINGVAADLVGAGSFSATVPLQLGANSIEAVAQGLRGETVSGKLTVTRTSAGSQKAKGGCSSTTGLEWGFCLALLPLLRRRRA